MKNKNIKNAFAYIVKVQEDLKELFKDAKIDLSLITVMNNAALPSFGS